MIYSLDVTDDCVVYLNLLGSLLLLFPIEKAGFIMTLRAVRINEFCYV